MKDSYPLNISNQTINSENCLKLVRIETDNTLSLDQLISTLSKKVSNQLTAMG